MSRFAAAIAASLILAAPIPAAAAPAAGADPNRRIRSPLWSGVSSLNDIKPPSKA